MENYTAVVLEPYKLKGKKDVRGIPMVEPELLKKVVTQLDADGFQVHFHAIGDGAVRQALDSDRGGAHRERRPRPPPPHLAHPADPPGRTSRASGKLDVVANFQPLWAYADAYITDLTLPFISKETARTCTRSRAWSAAARWSPSAATGRCRPRTRSRRWRPRSRAWARSAKRTTPWMPDERIALPEALAAFTINAAYTNRDETNTGSLEVGKLANLAVLDRNLFDIPGDRDLGHQGAGDAVRGQAGARRPGGALMKRPRHRVDPHGTRLPDQDRHHVER